MKLLTGDNFQSKNTMRDAFELGLFFVTDDRGAQVDLGCRIVKLFQRDFDIFESGLGGETCPPVFTEANCMPSSMKVTCRDVGTSTCGNTVVHKKDMLGARCPLCIGRDQRTPFLLPRHGHGQFGSHSCRNIPLGCARPNNRLAVENLQKIALKFSSIPISDGDYVVGGENNFLLVYILDQ